jgi:hypothetical protein
MSANYEKILIAFETGDIYNNKLICFFNILVDYNNGAKIKFSLSIEPLTLEKLSDFISEISDFIKGDKSTISTVLYCNSYIDMVNNKYVTIDSDDDRIHDTFIATFNKHPFIESLKLTLRDVNFIYNEMLKNNTEVPDIEYRSIYMATKMKCLLIWMGQKKQNCIFGMLNKELILIISDYVNQYYYDIIELTRYGGDT